MINKLEKANTEEVATLFNGKYGFTCKMRYIARKDIKEYYVEIFKMAQVKPYLPLNRVATSSVLAFSNLFIIYLFSP